MSMPLWNQRLAGYMVRPLVGTWVTPNHITTASLLLALTGAGLLATTDAVAVNWGAGIFMLARILDNFDGELARQGGQTSRFGHIYDYVVGCVSYSALFLALGIGLRGGLIGGWSIWLGGLAAPVILITTLMALRYSDATGGESDDYPLFAGFALEDGIYLIGPIAWFGWIELFFLLGAPSVFLFGLWTIFRSLRTTARHDR